MVNSLRRALFLSLFFIVFHHAQSQTSTTDAGVLVGKVMSETGRTLAGAKVFVTGASDSAMSDVDGKFSFRVPVGTRLVFIEAEGHELYQDTVLIEKDKDFYLNVVLQVVERMEAADIRVKRKAKENSVAQAIQTKRLSSQLVESISAEDFSKTTIRTTSDALKRIPGATISEGKFANVRGMFDRYNAGYLNGAPLPSTESDRKAFSFDVIPASLLDNIVVIKSATPDLIADFGGGIIKINTKSIPDKFTQSVSVGFQYNSITTGKSVRTFDIAGSEYFGVMSSANIAPNLDPKMIVDYNEPAFNAAETKKFNNNWDFNAYSAKPSPRFNYTIGIPFKIKKMQAGAMVSWNYSMTQRMALGQVITRDFSDNRLQRSFTDSTLSTNVQNGGVANFALKINNKNKIDFKNLYSLTYDVNSIVRAGTGSFDDNITNQAFSNFSNLNSLYSSQLIGSHVMGKRQSTLNWVLNYGNTVRQVPDFRIAQYSVSEGDVSTRQLVINPFFRDGSGRFFSTLNENSSSASVDYSTLRKMGKLTWILKTGAYVQHRSRVFNSRQFIYGPLTGGLYSQAEPSTDLALEKISPTGLYLIDKTRDKDDYTAFSSLAAAYVMAENQLPLFKKAGKTYDLKVIYGVRLEQFTQVLKSKEATKRNVYLANPGTNLDWMPSITSIIPVSKKSSVRMAYSKTLNRPELRELAPFAFYNFSINSEILGNTNLQRATIQNYDLRYEIYANKEDMVSIGVFKKRINNPIEFSLDPTQTQIRTFTYQNQRIANNKGLELEIRKNFGSLTKLIGAKWLKNFTFYGNVALISSEVKFDSVNSRTLQGQSPYVVNASLFYQNKKGWQMNASFNKIGQRIAYIGLPVSTAKFGLDIYEFGRSVLDVQIAKNVGKTGMFRVTFGDLLAQKSVFYQDMNANGKYDTKEVLEGGDNTLISFTNGRTIGVSYTFSF